MRVQITIDELVLEGFDARERGRIAEAIREAVSERLTRGDAIAQLLRRGSHDNLRGNDIVGHSRNARMVGTAIGASVVNVLTAGGATDGKGAR